MKSFSIPFSSLFYLQFFKIGPRFAQTSSQPFIVLAQWPFLLLESHQPSHFILVSQMVYHSIYSALLFLVFLLLDPTSDFWIVTWKSLLMIFLGRGRSMTQARARAVFYVYLIFWKLLADARVSEALIHMYRNPFSYHSHQQHLPQVNQI